MAPHQCASEASYKYETAAIREPVTPPLQENYDPLVYVTKSLCRFMKSERRGLPENVEDDGVMIRWCDWIRAYERLLERCEQQQKLETVLYTVEGSNSLGSCTSQDADEWLRFREAKHAEESAADVEEQLAVLLWDARADSASGIVAKLFAVLKKGEPSEDHSEFPWPQIRSVLVDLLCVDQTRSRNMEEPR
jgi:hypothetical protein